MNSPKRFAIIPLILTLQFLLGQPLSTHSSFPSATSSFRRFSPDTTSTASQAALFDRFATQKGIKISISGEIQSLNECKAAVYQGMSLLPPDHLSQLTSLVFTFDPEARRGLGGGETIKIRCIDVAPSEITAVFIHEMGHIVDTGLFQGTSGRTPFHDGKISIYRNDPSYAFYTFSWTREDRQKLGITETDFVSGYASFDVFEDFSETYTYYVLHGPEFRYLAGLNDILDKKYEFMRKNVFTSREFFTNDFELPHRLSRPYDVTKLSYHAAYL